jgi:tetratricopeptide (TPR) repeat protein
MAERLGLPDVRAQALDTRGEARASNGDPAGIDDLREALAISLELGLIRQTYVIYCNLVGILSYHDPAGSLVVADDGLEFVHAHGLPDGDAWIRVFRLQALFMTGRWSELMRSSSEVRAWAEPHGYTRMLVALAYPVAAVLSLTGRADEAAAFAADMEAPATEMKMAALFAPALIVHLREGGRTGEAAAELEHMMASFEQDRNGFFELACQAAREAVALDRTDLLPRMQALLSGRLALTVNALAVVSALSAEAAGRLDEAAAAFEVAERGWVAFGNPYERAHARLGRARCLAAAGQTVPAAELADSAMQAFDALGATPAAKEAAAVRDRVVD